MSMRAGFLVGAGAGLMAGAVAGMLMPYGHSGMRTPVGKSIHRLGVALDRAVDTIIEEMH